MTCEPLRPLWADARAGRGLPIRARGATGGGSPGHDQRFGAKTARSEGVAESRPRPLCVPRNVRSCGQTQVAAGRFSARSAGGVTEGGEQYTTVATVAVTCCSSRPTVGDRPDQHLTVVATAMVRCRPCPAPSVATGPRRGGRQRCSIFAEPRSAPSRPRPPGTDQRMRFSSRTAVRFCDHSRRSWTPCLRRRASVGIRQHPHLSVLPNRSRRTSIPASVITGKWSRVDLLERPSALDRCVAGGVSRAITGSTRPDLATRSSGTKTRRTADQASAAFPGMRGRGRRAPVPLPRTARVGPTPLVDRVHDRIRGAWAAAGCVGEVT